MSVIRGVIFDLDGVVVSTDEYHYRAWKKMAAAEGIPFGRSDNERLRGVSRMESLEIILEKSEKTYSDTEKAAMAERKNEIYRASLEHLKPSDILPGVMDMLMELQSLGIKTAIGSSSKNAQPILQAIGLDDAFDVIVDGTHIERSKPDPQVFTMAGDQLGLPPAECLVVEDAEAGVEAGLAAGMPVLAVGAAAVHPGATLRATDLTQISLTQIFDCM